MDTVFRRRVTEQPGRVNTIFASLTWHAFASLNCNRQKCVMFECCREPESWVVVIPKEGWAWPLEWQWHLGTFSCDAAHIELESSPDVSIQFSPPSHDMLSHLSTAWDPWIRPPYIYRCTDKYLRLAMLIFYSKPGITTFCWTLLKLLNHLPAQHLTYTFTFDFDLPLKAK